MISWLILMLELIILFFTSKVIFQALYVLSYKVFRNQHSATIPLFLLFFPGVIIHEISHLLIAEILFVKSYHMEIWPKVIHGRVQMGSIQIQNTDLIRRVLIGVAPIIVGVAFLSSILLIFVTNIGVQNIFSSSFNIFIASVVIWSVFVVTNTMFSSKRDVEGVIELFVVILFLGLVLTIFATILKIDILHPASAFLTAQAVIDKIKLIVLLLSIPVGLNTLMYILSKALIKKAY